MGRTDRPEGRAIGLTRGHSRSSRRSGQQACAERLVRRGAPQEPTSYLLNDTILISFQDTKGPSCAKCLGLKPPDEAAVHFQGGCRPTKPPAHFPKDSGRRSRRVLYSEYGIDAGRRFLRLEWPKGLRRLIPKLQQICAWCSPNRSRKTRPARNAEHGQDGHPADEARQGTREAIP